MTVLVISEWVVKEGKQEEFMALWQRFIDYYEKYSEKWKKMKLSNSIRGASVEHTAPLLS